MKKILTVLAFCLAAQVTNAQSGVQSVLNQLLGSGATSDAVTSIIENVVGNAVSKLDLSIEGTWRYSNPHPAQEGKDLQHQRLHPEKNQETRKTTSQNISEKARSRQKEGT